MRRIMLKSKIHRATVTDTQLEYEGSLTIDTDLLKAADILPHEQIHVWDVTGGARIITYALAGEKGSGIIRVNGAGAHLIKPGSLVIIATFTELKTKEAKKYKPNVIFVDADNKVKNNDPSPAIPETMGELESVQLEPHPETNGKPAKKKKKTERV